MSDTAPPTVAGETAEQAGTGALNAATIEAALAGFRAWLDEQAAADSVPRPATTAKPVDLHTLVGQFVALRHEVNLQTRATRQQQEQNRETLDQLARTLDELSPAGAAGTGARSDDAQRLFLKTLIELHDSLAQGRDQLQRSRQAVAMALAALAPMAAPPHGFFARCLHALGGRSHPEPQRLLEEAKTHALKLVDALLAGHAMALQRLDRALQQHELEPIDCLGQAFDPELMEAIEAVEAAGLPAGSVLEVVRQGYLWRDSLFRYALVKVARTS